MNFKPLKKSVLIAAIAFTGYGTMNAQVTTSSVQGVVASATGGTVKATHLPTGTVYTGTVSSSGSFNISNMKVGGPYTIEIAKSGETPLVFEDVYLELGQPFVLNPKSKDDTTDIAEVIISGARRTNTNKSGAATNVGLKQIQELPQSNRSITEFTRLTPQANGNSFAGRDARYNNLQIDGANFNNGFGLSSNPIPGGGTVQPISLDAIEEISVNIAPFDVTQSGFTGAGINAVTKSGTNKFHGSLYGYYNGKDITGWKINGEKLEKVSGAKMTNGLTVGGPILKNKLFFFLSGEREIATGANASGANLWKASQNGVADAANNITSVRESDLIAVRNHLINAWGYNPGRYQGYANEAEQSGDKVLARLDWNINDKHKFAVRYNYMKANSQQLANGTSGPNPRSSWNRVSANAMTFENGNYGFENTVQSVTAELNSKFSDKLSNKLLFTYSKIQDERTTPSNTLFPFVDIWDGSSSGGNYISFGTELFSYLNDVINNNYSFTNNLTYTAGKHTITGGIAYELQKFGNSYTRMGTGYYRYASVADFLTTGTANEVAPIMYGITYPYAGQETYSRINFGLGSAYIQDRFNVTDRFNFTLGIRAELPFYLNDLTANPSIDALELLDVNGNPTHYSSGEWPNSKVMISPRLGFNFDAMGDRSLIFRGGTGIFSGRVPFVWLTNMPTNAGVLQNTIEPGSYSAVSPWINQVRFHPENIYYYVENPIYYTDSNGNSVTPFISSPNEGTPSSFALVDRNFKMPSVWRSSFGVDYKIPNTRLTFSSDILYTKDVNAVLQFGANRKAATQLMTDGSGRDFYPTTASFTYNTAIGANSALVLTNTDKKGYSFSATAGFNLAPWKGLSGSAFYTYSEAKEVSANAGSSASSAWSGSPTINSPNEQNLNLSNFAIPHRIVANVSYTLKNTTIGVYYSGSSQGRFSYYYSNDVNGDGIANDLMYLPTASEGVNFVNIVSSGNVVYTAAQQQEAFDQFIANNDLEKYRGQILPRNGFLLPWTNRFDVRLSQTIFKDMTMKGDKVQITLDIMNFGNLLNSDWGIYNNNVSSYGAAVLGRSGALSTDPNYTMLRDSGELVTKPYRAASTTSTTWNMMLGFRYSF